MQFRNALYFLLASLAAICRADLLQYASQIPPCGITCILGELPSSACKVVTNSTCICTDTDLFNQVQSCVLAACTVEQALSISRIQDTACGRPYRSRRIDLYALIAVEAFTLICLSLRIYSRRNNISSYQADDYCALAILFIFLGFTVLGAYARLTGFGVDMWTLDSDTITTALKIFFIDETLYLAVLSLCKIAILCFFYACVASAVKAPDTDGQNPASVTILTRGTAVRIFPNKLFRAAVYTTIGFVASAAIVFIFLQIFQCMPLEYNWLGWKGTYGDHRCLNVNTLTYTAATFSIVQDAIILILPLRPVIRLNASWRKRAGIIIMFSLGVFILITSTIRLRYLVLFARSLNPTWDYTDTLIWTALEVNVSIIVISLPAIRLILAQVIPKVFATTIGSRATSHQQSSTKDSGKFASSSKQSTSRYSSVFVNSRRDEDAESQLELGDRVYGSTQVEIAVDYGQADDVSGDSEETGIHVRRTTVMSLVPQRQANAKAHIWHDKPSAS